MDGCHLRLRLSEHHARLQPGNDVPPAIQLPVRPGESALVRLKVLWWVIPQVTLRVLEDNGAALAEVTPKDGQEISFRLEGRSEPVGLTLSFDRWNGHPEVFRSSDPRPIALSFSNI